MQTIKYCNLDCEVLYNILLVFANEISKDLGITLQYTPTTSSMALKAFITKFLKPDVQIPIMKRRPRGRVEEKGNAGSAEEVGAGGKTREIAKSNEYIETVWGPCVGEQGTLILLAAGSQTENGPMEWGPDRSKLNSQSTIVY